ncbi:MAG: rhodanese-like domain-containing protein [Gammaproteobacteria bacterium]|nr:rhodanese-like domain-containing protein [Gammaproteobacteria bacterium]
MSLDFIARNWYLFAMLVGIIALLAVDPIRRRGSGVRSVSPLELPKLTRDPYIILDVSEPAEFKNGHLPESLNVPTKKLDQEIARLDKHKKKTVVVTCRSGNRSASAARTLIKHGFENVYTLQGGLLSWEKENLPVHRG